jgi:glutamine amidotransferase
LKQPVLGICLGMQLMCNKSEEGYCWFGNFDVDGQIYQSKKCHKWVESNLNLKSDLFKGISEYMYLVHSFMRQIALTPLLPQIMK